MKIIDLCLINKGSSEQRMAIWNAWADFNKVRIRRQHPSIKLLGAIDWARKARARNSVGRPPQEALRQMGRSKNVLIGFKEPITSHYFGPSWQQHQR